MQTLRGLTGQIAQVRLSPDGRFVAALAQTWKVGIWDTRANKLLHVLEVPAGLFADNAALTFDSDSRRLAFAAGNAARLWDVETGKELRTWKLPPGLVDLLTFDRKGQKLLLFRVETRDGNRLPNLNAPPVKHPRVCRLRDLLGAKPLEPLAQIPDFNYHVFCAAAAPDGKYFVVFGAGGTKGERRMLQAFDGGTGKALWAHPREYPKAYSGFLAADPTGETVAIQTTLADSTDVLEMPSGRTLLTLPIRATALGPGGDYWGDFGSQDFHGFALHQGSSASPAITLGIDTKASGWASFSREGNRLAWGNADGSVMVCDLPAVKRRLAEFELDW